jgi:hypothetical protein
MYTDCDSAHDDIVPVQRSLYQSGKWLWVPKINKWPVENVDRLCGLVFRVLDYRFGGPGSIAGTIRKKVVGLERGPLSVMSKTEELHDRKVAAPA